MFGHKYILASNTAIKAFERQALDQEKYLNA